jgi:hypothetical protein
MVPLQTNVKKQKIMNLHRYIITGICVLAITASALAGGGWPQPKGKGYFKISEWWMVADEHFTDVGLKDPNITAGLYNTSLYGEYGFTDRLTGILYAPIFSRAYFNNQVSATSGAVLKEGEAINSLGDIDLALKYGITKPGAPIAISATLLIGIPSGEDAGGSEQSLQTGDGEFNQMIKLDIGKSFGNEKVGLYANVYGGFNNRTNDYSDEFRYGAELGLGLMSSKLWLVGRLAGVESFNNGKLASEVVSTSIFANNAEFTTIGAEANFYITKNLGLSAGFATPLSGKIVYAAPSYSVGVFYDLK